MLIENKSSKYILSQKKLAINMCIIAKVRYFLWKTIFLIPYKLICYLKKRGNIGVAQIHRAVTLNPGC